MKSKFYKIVNFFKPNNDKLLAFFSLFIVILVIPIILGFLTKNSNWLYPILPAFVFYSRILNLFMIRAEDIQKCRFSYCDAAAFALTAAIIAIFLWIISCVLVAVMRKIKI